MRGLCLGLASIVAGLAGLGGAEAAPLAKEECEKLKIEQEQLNSAGVRAQLAKGPDWAKANLKADQISQIARLIDLDAQVTFRCIEPKSRPDLQAAGPRPRVKLKQKAAAAAGEAQPAADPKAQPAPAPAKARAAAAPPPTATKAVAPKPTPRPKANDAFVPPAAAATPAPQPTPKAAPQ